MDLKKSLYIAAFLFIYLLVYENIRGNEDTENHTLETGGKVERVVDIVVSEEQQSLNNYYFSKLQTDVQKNVYNKIYEGLSNSKTEIYIEGVSDEMFKSIYKCVSLDNPELFYVDTKYTYIPYKKYGNEKKIVLYPKYNMTVEEKWRAEKQINVYVENVLQQMNPSMTAYEKEKVIYEYIASNTKYLTESDNNQSMYSVVQGESVCLGYSKMFQYLCKKVGINCTIVTGTNKEGIGHAWNCVYLDGNWYMVDCTNSVGQLTDTADEISYYFFNITKSQMLRTNNINNIVELPDCESLEQEYYYRNGLYYKEVDTERLTEQIKQRLENGEDALTIRCGDEEVLNGLYKWLITERNIFNILDSSYQVNYVESSELMIMQIKWGKGHKENAVGRERAW